MKLKKNPLPDLMVSLVILAFWKLKNRINSCCVTAMHDDTCIYFRVHFTVVVVVVVVVVVLLLYVPSQQLWSWRKGQFT